MSGLLGREAAGDFRFLPWRILPEISCDEEVRLAALKEYRILDTPPDPRTDIFVELAADLFDMPISLISLIDKNRQWFKASVGVAVTETSRDLAFCSHAILAPAEVMVVEDARLDARFFDNDLVTGDSHIRFYAGAPIVSPEGFPLGTLCVIDRKPRKLNATGRKRLANLANGAASVLALHRSAERLQRSATHDHLTGLPNRALFEPTLSAAVQQANTGGPPCAVLCLDLDRFKRINDRFGHAGGDLILRVAGERLQECIRDTEIAARLGGDEFSVMLVGVSSAAAVRDAARRIINAFSKPIDIENKSVVVGTSIGFAMAPLDGQDGAKLMRLADAALYRVKAAGRGSIRWHQDPSSSTRRSADDLLGDLRQAVEDKAFTLHWQPYFRAQSGRLCGQEALICWHRPNHGFVPPDVFVAKAEEHGLIQQIDTWVLEMACLQAVSWPQTELVAVNVSPSMFCSDSFVSKVAEILQSTGLEPDRLVLEITERTAINEGYETAKRFDELHKLGIRIALDDFGCGHAALGSLQKYKFDELKLDRSLVANICDEPRSRLALEGIILLAHSLGMLTCAEGVETEEQLAFLRDSGCDMVQGFLLGRPTLIPQFSGISAADL